MPHKPIETPATRRLSKRVRNHCSSYTAPPVHGPARCVGAPVKGRTSSGGKPRLRGCDCCRTRYRTIAAPPCPFLTSPPTDSAHLSRKSGRLCPKTYSDNEDR